MNKKGFLNIIIAVIVATVIAGGVYFVINKKTSEPVVSPVITTPRTPETLSQLLNSSEQSRDFLIELQRLNPKLDINKSTGGWDEEKQIITDFLSWPITSIKKPAVMPNITDAKWVFSPKDQKAFYDSGCFKEGDMERLDVITTNNGQIEIETIYDWGRACPNGNGFWLSDTKLAYAHAYSYTQIEPESSNFQPASTRAVKIYIFDFTKGIINSYYVESPDVIIWPPLSYEYRRRNLAICEERNGVGNSSCLGFSSVSQLGIDISSDGKSIFDYNGKIILTIKDMLLSDKFISFAKDNDFRRYDDPDHSSFLKIIPLPQSAYMISSCLNCYEDLYNYEVSFIFNTTDGALRYFYGDNPRFSPDKNFLMLGFGGDAEVTAFAVNIYETSTAELMGILSSRGIISDFAKKTFNITEDTFVTFEFSPDSKSIIITSQVYDGNNYKPFTSKLMSDLDGKNLRVFNGLTTQVDFFPTQIGQCHQTIVTAIEFDSWREQYNVAFANKGLIIIYSTAKPSGFAVSDSVNFCYVGHADPSACEELGAKPGDLRPYVYSAKNLNTGAEIEGSPNLHVCSGA